MKFHHSVSSSPLPAGLGQSHGLHKLWRIIREKIQLEQWFNALERTAMQQTAPTAHWKHSRQGKMYLEIYDPATAQYHYFGSEEEALIWLEKRYLV
jgi:hypothetical protein